MPADKVTFPAFPRRRHQPVVRDRSARSRAHAKYSSTVIMPAASSARSWTSSRVGFHPSCQPLTRACSTVSRCSAVSGAKISGQRSCARNFPSIGPIRLMQTIRVGKNVPRPQSDRGPRPLFQYSCPPKAPNGQMEDSVPADSEQVSFGFLGQDHADRRNDAENHDVDADGSCPSGGLEQELRNT